jgi:hypothetical protein
MRHLSDAHLTRLEFRTSAAVKHAGDELLLPRFVAADTSFFLRLILLIPRYLAAGSTTVSISRQISLLKAVQATMKALFFSAYLLPFKAFFQQIARLKAIFLTRRFQQDFSITPREFLLISWRTGSHGWLEDAIRSVLVSATTAWEDH